MAKRKSLKKKVVEKKVPTHIDIILLESHGVYKKGQTLNVKRSIGLSWIEAKKAKSTEQKEKTDTELVLEKLEENKD